MNKIPPIVIAKIEEAKEKQLKKLDLSWNSTNSPLKEIPPKVFDLKHLEVLNLSNNCIEYIPDEILNLQKSIIGT